MPKARSFEKYGHFDDRAREFVVTHPYPPKTWINYLGNRRMFAILSQGGGGMCFHGDARTGRLTRYHQYRGVPIDHPGLWTYVREKSGTIWSPTFQPCRTKLDGWTCRHGQGYSTFEGTYRGLASQATYFVAPDDDVMLWTVELHNRRTRAAEVTVVPYAEFSFLYADEEIRSFHWSKGALEFSYDPKLAAVKYRYVHPFSPRRFPVFFSATRVPDSFTCNRDAFIGPDGTYAAPQEVRAAALGCEDVGGGSNMACGALAFRATIPPGRRWRVAAVLGAATDWRQANRLIRKYRRISAVDDQRRKLRAFYADWNAVLKAKLPDGDMERYVNTWAGYACRQCFEHQRHISSVHTGMERGGPRTRDSMQDAQAIAHIRPDWARELIVENLTYQHPQGCYVDNYNKNFPEDFKPHGHHRQDNPVWPVFATYAYVAETGDTAFLRQEVPYYKGKSAPVFEHLLQGLKYIYARRGPNGLALLGGGDWNDSIGRFAGRDAESVLISQQLAYCTKLMTALARPLRRRDVVPWCRRVFRQMAEAVNDAGWDGKWYRTVLHADPKEPPIGSAQRLELKLYPYNQSWAVISGTATPERGVQAMDALWDLDVEPFGCRMGWPPATGTPKPPAPLLTNFPGVGENGGVFNQPCGWFVQAEATQGRGDQAFDMYRRCLPPVVSDRVGIERYGQEPYCYASHLLAPPQAKPGAAQLPWLTGTAPVMFMAATQYILGIRPTIRGLEIDPCIPRAWKGFHVQRRFRGAVYDIDVRNPDGVCKGMAELTVDGKAVKGILVKPVARAKRVKVVATMGAAKA